MFIPKEDNEDNRKFFKLKAQSKVSAEEIGDWLGVSGRTIKLWSKQWLESGGNSGMPAYKLGDKDHGHWRWDLDAIWTWWCSRQHPVQGLGPINTSQPAPAEKKNRTA